MAQDFKRHTAIVTSANTDTALFTADSNDCIVGIHCANVGSQQITVDVFVRVSPANTSVYLVKSAPIPVGSSLSIDGKFNVASGDILRVQSDTANALHVYTSIVDEIST
jgi:hypothetical protein